MSLMIKIFTIFSFLFFPFTLLADNFVDMIIVDKSQRILKLLKDGSIVKTYNIDLGFEPLGHKQKRGDGKTPEGLYYINKKLFESDFHIALQISYPNKWDLRKSKINKTNPGGSIMIHGKPNDKDLVERSDWTNGCIAVTNSQIEEINRIVKLKTPIYIKK